MVDDVAASPIGGASFPVQLSPQRGDENVADDVPSSYQTLEAEVEAGVPLGSPHLRADTAPVEATKENAESGSTLGMTHAGPSDTPLDRPTVD